MSEHNHEHDTITLVDNEGNEYLYEVIMRIDGSENFGKQYILVTEAGVSEDEESEVYAYSYTENEDGTQGELQPVETDEEWDMIEITFEAGFEALEGEE
ncbi:Uncharacterized protein YrzB, UPF0473 family [Pilibacter termitis]|uniref:UPF0473 protein SAMN02745116_00205 n=1 Tax=Pilibacter termitis TaxID=263852 RepID=A0A1T4KDT9_9ENTE|nr:DUF1292 domain-containing protein [Pilibacter termitis]SJZ40594.1 Uncharacterized protein YrzB, UPF0473 family [Pilibacter termitis]